MAGKFELFTAKNGKTHFNLKASNGQVILSSQGYASRSGARNGIESVRKNAVDPKRFEKKTAKNGKFHFVLKAANSQVIGSSELYDTERACDNGMASVTRHAPGAKIADS
jgi:uncharacterized protein YegP (UPF0339 family)